MSVSRKISLFLIMWIIFSRIYGLIRFGLEWFDPDTAILGFSVKSVITHGRLIDVPYGYGNGFGYPALASFVVLTTSIPIEIYQIAVSKIAGILILLMAYTFYKKMFGHSFALLAVFILSTSDFFTSYTIIGSHNPYTTFLLLMMLTSFYAMLFNKRPHLSRGYIAVFVASSLAISTYNVYYSSSMGIIFLIALLSVILLSKLVKESSFQAKTMLKPTPYLLFNSFIMAFWIYPQSLGFIRYYKFLSDQIMIFFFSLNPRPVALQKQVAFAYPNFETFILMQVYDAGISVLSAFSYFFLLYSRRKIPIDLRKKLFFVMNIFLGYAFVAGMAFAYDFSGHPIFGHANVRVFGFFAPLLIVPTVYIASKCYGAKLSATVNKLIRIILILIIAVGMFTLPFHSTADPLFFNGWFVHSVQERTGVVWAAESLPVGAKLYVGPDTDRLTNTYYFYVDLKLLPKINPFGRIDDSQFYLYSDFIVEQAMRLKVNLEEIPSGVNNIVYSSGNTMVLEDV